MTNILDTSTAVAAFIESMHVAFEDFMTRRSGVYCVRKGAGYASPAHTDMWDAWCHGIDWELRGNPAPRDPDSVSYSDDGYPPAQHAEDMARTLK